MYDHKSVYGKNKKDWDAIVCPTANGRVVRLTVSDFSSEEEFKKWKEWSDADYHSSSKEIDRYYKRTVSLHSISERISVVVDFSGTLQKEEHFNSVEEIYDWFSIAIQSCLTAKERRRFWYYIIEGLTMEKIARIENVSQQSISESLASARRKFKKYLKTL